jgi:hypothetical protein
LVSSFYEHLEKFIISVFGDKMSLYVAAIYLKSLWDLLCFIGIDNSVFVSLTGLEAKELISSF